MADEPHDDPSAVTVGPSGDGARPRPAPSVKPSPWETPTVRGDATPGAPGPAGALLGRYPITGHLGEGGMGEVFEVQDPDLGRRMAAKVMRDESGSGHEGKLARFVQEAQITGQLEHPGIVPLHELGMTLDGRVYFTMKRVEGRTLAELIEAERGGACLAEGASAGRLRWLDIFGKICDALRFAHSRGVIHRDLKPANVMVGAFGEVQVMDWGLARTTRVIGRPDPVAASWQLDLGRGPIAELAGGAPLRTQDGAVVGTPAYMPPEQAGGQADERSDIYPKYAAAYTNRGISRRAKGDLDGAIADHTCAIALEPKLAVAYDNRGVVRQAMGDLIGAIADHTRAIALEPKLPMAYAHRGVVRQAQGDLDGAIADFTCAIELDPKDAKAYNNRGNARKAKGDLDGAITDYTRAIELQPDLWQVWANLGLARAAKGQTNQAIAELEKAHSLAPAGMKPQLAAHLQRIRGQR